MTTEREYQEYQRRLQESRKKRDSNQLKFYLIGFIVIVTALILGTNTNNNESFVDDNSSLFYKSENLEKVSM